MGQSVQTFTAQIVSGGLIAAGVPSPYAHMAGGLTEIGVAAVSENRHPDIFQMAVVFPR
jgi:hypothetical protein